MENETKKSNEPRALTVETGRHVDSFSWNMVEMFMKACDSHLHTSWTSSIRISHWRKQREMKVLNPNWSKLFLWWQWQCTSKDVTYIIYFVHFLSLYGTAYLFLYIMRYWLWGLWLSQNWGHSAAVCCSVCIQGWGVHHSSWEPNNFSLRFCLRNKKVPSKVWYLKREGYHREKYTKSVEIDRYTYP